MPRKHRDIVTQTFVVTNHTDDLSIAGDEATTANVAAVLTTLISELEKKGIVEATVTAP